MENEIRSILFTKDNIYRALKNHERIIRSSKNKNIEKEATLYSLEQVYEALELFDSFHSSSKSSQELILRILSGEHIQGFINAGSSIEDSKKRRLQKEISETIKSLGFIPHLKGYGYLKDAIIISVNENRGRLKMKIVYQEIAVRNHTVSGCVQNAIAYAVQKAWDEGSLKIRGKVLECKVDFSERAPTNAEVIIMITESIIQKINNV